MFTLRVSSKSKSELISLNREIIGCIKESRFLDGLCVVFVPHTTAGITINENADPDVKSDMLRFLDRLVPWSGDFKHIEGNSAAHIKASLMGSSVTILVEKGQLMLGTWQDVYLAEFDGPRERQIFIKLLGTYATMTGN